MQAFCARVYPRVYGGTNWWPVVRSGRSGSIPACTGEPSRYSASVGRITVYPRVYGGTTATEGTSIDYDGLSPRVRGNPPNINRARRALAVYPRVYGGTLDASTAVKRTGGLSPRVRGNRPSGRCSPKEAGSIPACTGEPGPVVLSPGCAKVYPRVYGGTSSSSCPVSR